MLDMGFIHDIRKVLRLLPARRQNLLFSATLPPDITRLAGAFLDDPVRVEVNPPTATVDKIDQSVLFVDRRDKPRLLIEQLAQPGMSRVLVFTRTKHGANRLVKQLDRAGIEAAAIHGNKSQNARRKALAGFHAGTNGILVATDLASRGIDVEEISHVFNYDLPHEPEVYVHRIGRTGRAGLGGVAISFCDASEAEDLRAIERLIGQSIPVNTDHAHHSPEAMRAQPRSTATQRDGRGAGHRSGQTRRARQPAAPPGRSRAPRRRRPRSGRRTG